MTLIKDRSKICLCISLGIMVVALLLSLFGAGINVGLDFSGGVNMTYQMNSPVETDDVAAALDSLGMTSRSISTMGETNSELQIRLQDSGEMDIQELRASLEALLIEKYPDMDTENVVTGYVGPVAGATLLRNAISSVLLASLLMLIYIAFRFDLYSGIAAVFGLLHDVLIMLSMMVLLRNVVQMNSSFIAAMLTIIGYSINNTIIIFDRVREIRKSSKETDNIVIANRAISESLGRTVNTTMTTLITIVTLSILGVSAIREFALPIIVGIVSGVYSSNMINCYVWAWLEKRYAGKLRVKKA